MTAYAFDTLTINGEAFPVSSLTVEPRDHHDATPPASRLAEPIEFTVSISLSVYNELIEMVDTMAEERERRALALRRFKRAMRRHEKRARRRGFQNCARMLRAARLGDEPCEFAVIAAQHRKVSRRPDVFGADRDAERRVSFIHERAADAIAKLRSAT